MFVDGLLVYWGLTPQQQPGSYQGGEMMMKSVFWWRKPEYPEETTDLRQVTDETFHCLLMLHYDPRAVPHYHRAFWTQCPDQNGHWAYEGQHCWLRGIHTSDKNGNALPAQRISKFPSKFGS